MPRPRLTPAQALLLAALAIVLALLWGKRPRPPAEPVAPAQGTSAFDESAVTEIGFGSPGSVVVVVREADGWWVREPFRDKADDRFLRSSIRVAATLAPDRVLPDTQSALFGLDRPQAVWWCRGDRFTHRIELGDTLPDASGRFARTSLSPQILVVNAFLTRRYLAPPSRELHEPRAARLEVGPLDSVRVETREEKILLARDRGVWRIVRPIEAPADEREVARAIEVLRSESLVDVLEETSAADLKRLGLDPPRAVWTLVQGGREERVRIGHPTPDEGSVHLIPAGRSVVARIGSGPFRVWVDGVVRLRDPRLVGATVDTLTRLKVEGAGRTLSFARRPGAEWQASGPGRDPSPAPRGVAMAIENLCAAQAISFRAGPGAPPPDAYRFVMGWVRGGSDTIAVSRPSGGTGLAWTARQPGACVVPARLHQTWAGWLGDPDLP